MLTVCYMFVRFGKFGELPDQRRPCFWFALTQMNKSRFHRVCNAKDKRLERDKTVEVSGETGNNTTRLQRKQ